MKLIRSLPLEEMRKKQSWHKYFAWYPVRTNIDSLVWLETVERRLIYNLYCKVVSKEYRELNEKR